MNEPRPSSLADLLIDADENSMLIVGGPSIGPTSSRSPSLLHDSFGYDMCISWMDSVHVKRLSSGAIRVYAASWRLL